MEHDAYHFVMTYITGKKIVKFILNYIICHYGIPQSIITDNGLPFKNQDVYELCEKFHIQHHFATLWRLLMMLIMTGTSSLILPYGPTIPISTPLKEPLHTPLFMDLKPHFL